MSNGNDAVAQDLENTLYLDLKDGRVVIQLRPDLAPKHVARIKELTREGFYDGLKFHRVIEGFMAQTGDDVLEAIRQCPAHAIIVNAPRAEQLQTLVDDLRVKAPATPIVGCVFPVRPQQGLEEGILRYLIKPVVRADMEEALQATPSPVHRVLIVDDVPDVRHLFARMLHSVREDIAIDMAATGVEALEAMKRGRPDLVLLDVILPDMDGWQVLKYKKRDPEIAHIPTIMVSAEDPNRQPMRSDLLMTGIGSGFSIADLMNCSLALSEELLHAPHPSPVPARQ